MAAEVRTSFRAILRHVKRLPTIGSPAHGHRSFIINKFREGKDETDAKVIRSLRTKANTLAMLVSSTDELNRLKMLDTGNFIEDSEKVANTAKGLGFTMPDVYDGNESSSVDISKS